MKANKGLRYRSGVASRAIAAILGGYALTTAAIAFLALTLPMARVDAVQTATLLSFFIYACAIVWVFAARDAWHAWLGILIPFVSLAMGVMVLRGAA